MNPARMMLALAVVLAAGASAAPAHAQSADTALYLEPLPPRATPGTDVVLYGWLEDDSGLAVPYATIYVKDDVDLGRDRTVAVLTTAEDGTFAGTWTAEPRPSGGSWDFYAVFEGAEGLQKSRSRTHSVAVAEDSPPRQPAARQSTDLYLDPLPSSAAPGVTVDLYGWLADSGGFAVPYATVYVKDDVDLGRDRTVAVLTTAEDGTFAGTWTAELRPSGGSWDFYAVFEGAEGLQKSRSRTYSVAVEAAAAAQPLPTRLSLDPVPAAARVGQAVAFTGALSSGGGPVAGALVEIKDDDTLRPDDTLASALTGSDGRFAVSWTAEQGLIEAELEVYAEYDGDGAYGPSSTPRQIIEVLSAAAPEPTSISLDPLPGSVYAGDEIVFAGLLLSGDAPLAGAYVDIYEDDPLRLDQHIGRGLTDSGGRFSVPWTASAGLVEIDFDIYAEFGGGGGHAKSQTRRHEVSVLRYGGDISLDPLPRDVVAGDLVVFRGSLELDMHSPQGAKVYIMDEDPLNPDDLLATAYVESDGRFAANWFAYKIDADSVADVYAVFEGGGRLHRLTTCDEGPTPGFGGSCPGTVHLSVQGAPGGFAPGGGRPAGGPAYNEMYYSMDIDGQPRVAIVPSPDRPADSRRYIAPAQEGILTWTLSMERRYGGDWDVAFAVVEPGAAFFDARPDVVMNLVSADGDAGCLDEYAGWAMISREPIRPVQTTVCVTGPGGAVSTADAAGTAAHEFIHAVGLGHAFNKAGDMMCSVEDGQPTCPRLGSKARIPSDLNAAAVANMYGTDGFAAPNNHVAYKSRFYDGEPPAGADRDGDPAPPAPARADAAAIPGWIKASAGWWADGLISDEEFARGIGYLIQSGIVSVAPGGTGGTGGTGGGSPSIPEWIKASAGWWADGLISDEEFARGIGHLVSTGVILA